MVMARADIDINERMSVDIDLSDIDSDDLISELNERKLKASSVVHCGPLVESVRFAMNSKNKDKFLEAAQNYFYERYGMIGGFK